MHLSSNNLKFMVQCWIPSNGSLLSRVLYSSKTLKYEENIKGAGKPHVPVPVCGDATCSFQNRRYSSVKSDTVSRRETAFATGLKIQF